MRAWTLVLALFAGGATARDARLPPGVSFENTAYNGRFTFVRIRYEPSRWGPGNYIWGLDLKWNHDYPRAETHFMKILKETTTLDPNLGGGNILALDDPELFKYPVAFMWEPGFWNLTDREAVSFRAWLNKGGFAVFEDFDGPSQWSVFEAQMRRVLPEGRLVRLDQTHPIFDTFFRIQDINAIVHPMTGIAPSYYGIFEDNDPSQRLMVVANFDNDVPEYWEWSGEGLFPFDASNEAYKLGVNYLIYGMTH